MGLSSSKDLAVLKHEYKHDNRKNSVVNNDEVKDK